MLVERESVPLEGTLDIDSHEMAPSHLWGDVFGEASGRIGELLADSLRDGARSDIYNPDVTGDVEEITPQTVWTVRGTRAPGAFDFVRRITTLDMMGIHRQLVFPTYGIVATQLTNDYSFLLNAFESASKIEMDRPALKALGRAGIDEYNNWAMRMSRLAPDRLRMVACLPPAASVSDLIDQLQDLIAGGIRGVLIQSGIPPAGLSPADPNLDQFWSLLAEHKVTCTTHVGGNGDFLKFLRMGKCTSI